MQVKQAEHRFPEQYRLLTCARNYTRKERFCWGT